MFDVCQGFAIVNIQFPWYLSLDMTWPLPQTPNIVVLLVIIPCFERLRFQFVFFWPIYIQYIPIVARTHLEHIFDKSLSDTNTIQYQHEKTKK